MTYATAPKPPPSTSRRKFVSRSQRGISHKNNHFPRAKLARHLRCAALVPGESESLQASQDESPAPLVPQPQGAQRVVKRQEGERKM